MRCNSTVKEEDDFDDEDDVMEGVEANTATEVAFLPPPAPHLQKSTLGVSRRKTHKAFEKAVKRAPYISEAAKHGAQLEEIGRPLPENDKAE